MTVDAGNQHVLERTAVILDSKVQESTKGIHDHENCEGCLFEQLKEFLFPILFCVNNSNSICGSASYRHSAW